jgi:hypothetical protein
MKRLIPLILVCLAACGIDGAPISPAEAEEKERDQERGVNASGTASIGISSSL